MANHPLSIDTASLFNNVDERTVEFSAVVDDERRDFAVQYDVLEALSGAVPDDAPVAVATRFADEIAQAALSALGRDSDGERIAISENDLA